MSFTNSVKCMLKSQRMVNADKNKLTSLKLAHRCPLPVMLAFLTFSVHSIFFFWEPCFFHKFIRLPTPCGDSISATSFKIQNDPQLVPHTSDHCCQNLTKVHWREQINLATSQRSKLVFLALGIPKKNLKTAPWSNSRLSRLVSDPQACQIH